MKFSCGENWHAKYARLKSWHPHFCWFPVSVKVVDGRDICAWLEWVERKGECDYGTLYEWEWEYRERT